MSCKGNIKGHWTLEKRKDYAVPDIRQHYWYCRAFLPFPLLFLLILLFPLILHFLLFPFFPLYLLFPFLLPVAMPGQKAPAVSFVTCRYTVQCTLYTVHCADKCVLCRVFSLQCVGCSVQCAVCSVQDRKLHMGCCCDLGCSACQGTVLVQVQGLWLCRSRD